MAPRKSAATTAVAVAAEFDFDAFLGEFHRPEFTRALFRRADLVPQIADMGRELDDLETRIERTERTSGEDGVERDITAVDPLAVLKRRREDLTDRWNSVVDEFNESEIRFTFRVPDDKDDHGKIQALLAVDGIGEPEKTVPLDGESKEDKAAREAAFNAEFNEFWDALTIRSMSVTCKSHNFSVRQWEALRERVGVIAFASLMEAWAEAVAAAKPTAPFSRRPSHTSTTVVSSDA